MQVYGHCNYIAQKIAFNANLAAQNPVDAKISQFREKGDLYKWAKFLNSDEFPHKNADEIRGKYIAEYVDSLKEQARIKLNVDIRMDNPSANYHRVKNLFFAPHNPEAYYQVYETVENYKTLAGFAKEDAHWRLKGVYPREIQIKDFKGKAGGDCNGWRIRLDEGSFKEKKLRVLSNDLEHEIGHLYSDTLNGSSCRSDLNYKPCGYLDILSPEEKKLYLKFEEIYKKGFDAVNEQTVLNLRENFFNLPSHYDNENATLPTLKRRFDILKNLKGFFDQEGKKQGIPNLFNKVNKIVKKLTKFKDDFPVSDNDGRAYYYLSTPDETKAQTWAIRASGKAIRPDYLLPVTEKMEGQLAKLGMPEPMKYTILPKDFFAKKQKN